MSRNETFPHVEKSYSRLPIKIPHTRYKEYKKYPGFCSNGYEAICTQGRTITLESKSDVQCNSKARCRQSSADKSTQMNIKNFYGAHILEGLVNTNTDIKKNDNSVNNANNSTDDRDPLSDIKNILLTTNDKLDIILSTLADKGQSINGLRRDPSNRLRKHKPNKYRTRSENTRSSLNLNRPPARDNQLGDIPDPAQEHPWSKCMSSTSIAKISSNPYLVSPYFPPYYIRPISHYNYFKIFGPKYSDPDMTSNFWSPFMFMATSFNANNIQSGFNDRAVHCLENEKRNRLNYGGEPKGRAGVSRQVTETLAELDEKREFSGVLEEGNDKVLTIEEGNEDRSDLAIQATVAKSL